MWVMGLGGRSVAESVVAIGVDWVAALVVATGVG